MQGGQEGAQGLDPIGHLPIGTPEVRAAEDRFALVKCEIVDYSPERQPWP